MYYAFISLMFTFNHPGWTSQSSIQQTSGLLSDGHVSGSHELNWPICHSLEPFPASVFLQRTTFNMAQDSVLVLFQQRPGPPAAVGHSIKVILPLELLYYLLVFLFYIWHLSLSLSFHSSFSSGWAFITLCNNIYKKHIYNIFRKVTLFPFSFLIALTLNTVHQSKKYKNDLWISHYLLFPTSYII